jgi:3-phosphoglycerate kinase
MAKFKTLDDVDVKGKRVLLRVDLNVPRASSASRRPSPRSPTRVAR